MLKLEKSQSRFFLASDSVFDAGTQLIREVTSKPKKAFRMVFLFGAALAIWGAFALVEDIVVTKLINDNFKQEHAALTTAINSFNDGKVTQPPYTLEQRAVALKMFRCMAAKPRRIKGEESCSAEVVADAAFYGGEQRALAVKSNLVELGFKTNDWF